MDQNRSIFSKFPSEPLQWKRKQLGIPFRGTEIEAKSRNSLPNPSAEEKTTRNSVPRNQNRRTLGIPLRTILRKRKQLGQNAATSVSDSIQIESSCRGRKNWTRCSRVWMRCSRVWMRCSQVCMRCSQVFMRCIRVWMRCSRVWMTEWLERLTANVEVAIVLGSFPASSDTVDDEALLNTAHTFKKS